MFVDNYWAGYSQYRYGIPGEKPKLARSSRSLSGDKRKSAIDKIIGVLKDWRLSPFENEGLCVSSLRTALCLHGQTWLDADDEARSLVASAFTIIGTARPTWAEGQPEYSTPIENCQWCSSELPDDVRDHGRKGRFCSVVCAKSFHQYRARTEAWRGTTVAQAAYNVVAKEKARSAECKTCGGSFKARRGEGRGIYCSRKCQAVGSRRQAPLKPCKHCGTMFRPLQGKPGTFCSTACHLADMDKLAFERWCLYCGVKFFAKRANAIYCSDAHRVNAAHRRAKCTEALATGKPYTPLVGSFELSCIQCGDEFPAKSTKEKFCCNDCQATNWRARFHNNSFVCQEVA